MACSKDLKSDPKFVNNLKKFIDALFTEETPSDLLNPTTTKLKMLQFYAGDEYTSFKDFDHSIKSHTKRALKKGKRDEFINTHKLEMHPHSAYAIFLKENNDKYKKENPDKSHKELRSLMTKVWSEFSDKDKKPYEASYIKQKETFIERVREIDPEYVALFDKSLAPKVAPRPYTLFVTEQMKIIRSENPDILNKSVMKLAGEKWRSLSDSDKKKYYTKCGAEMPVAKSDTVKKTTTTTVKKDTEAEDVKSKPKTKMTPKKVESDSEDDHKSKSSKSTKSSHKKVESDSEEESVPKKNISVVKSKGKAKGKAALDTVLDNSDQSDSD